MIMWLFYFSKLSFSNPHSLRAHFWTHNWQDKKHNKVIIRSTHVHFNKGVAQIPWAWKVYNNDLAWEVNITKHLPNRFAKLGDPIISQFQYQNYERKKSKKFIHEVKRGKAWWQILAATSLLRDSLGYSKNRELKQNFPIWKYIQDWRALQ